MDISAFGYVRMRVYAFAIQTLSSNHIVGPHASNQGTRSMYDRQLLLLGAKRNATLELWEIQRYGTDSYDDPDYVSIYGLRPVDWYSKGIRC